MAKRLRSGYTTGACSAAAAKAALARLLELPEQDKISITFPDGSIHSFAIHQSQLRTTEGTRQALASIIKDAGDDPDVTNGAAIFAEVSHGHGLATGKDCVKINNMMLCRGEGVGRTTKPGLAVAVNEPAINPVPRQMILQAVEELTLLPVTVSIGVLNGIFLAEKTLNHRLGVVDGLSILGTTGVVRPVSADAWTATIAASMDVAKEAGLTDIVLSTGRTSEKGAEQLLCLPEEAYAMMGDYLEFSLKQAQKTGFTKIHLAGMWAKITKAALRIPQTHVRNGALEIRQAADLLQELGADGLLLEKLYRANTAREMLDHLQAHNRMDIIEKVCLRARKYGQDVSGLEVCVYLVNNKAEIITHV